MRAICETPSKVDNYRIVLGINPATKTALTEMSNEDLRTKALLLAAKLETLCSNYLETSSNARKANNSAQAAFVEEQYGRELAPLKADLANVHEELVHRLPANVGGAIANLSSRAPMAPR